MIEDEKGGAEEAEGAENSAADIAADDPHKTEKLTKLGRDEVDPNEGSD